MKKDEASHELLVKRRAVPETAVLGELVAVIGDDDEERLFQREALRELLQEALDVAVRPEDAFVIELFHEIQIPRAKLLRNGTVSVAIDSALLDEDSLSDSLLAVRIVNVHEVKVEEERRLRRRTGDPGDALADHVLPVTGLAALEGNEALEPLVESELGLEPRIAHDRGGAVTAVTQPLGERSQGLVEVRADFAPGTLAVERALLSVVLDRRLGRVETGEKTRDRGHRL